MILNVCIYLVLISIWIDEIENGYNCELAFCKHLNLNENKKQTCLVSLSCYREMYETHGA